MSVPSEAKTYIRNAIGDADSDLFNDATLDLYWDDAADVYSDTRVIRYAVIVELLNARIVSAAEDVTYRFNTEAENLSDTVKALMKLRDEWQAKLDALIDEQSSMVRLGRPKKVPSRLKDMPDDY